MGAEARTTRAGADSVQLDARLCYMPFGLLVPPSVALGLLQAAATREGARVESRYFSLAFANTIGFQAYETISRGLLAFGIHEVGQWIFSSALYPDQDLEPDLFVENILRKTSLPYRPHAFPEDLIEMVLAIRGRVRAFLDRSALEALAGGPKLIGFSCSPHQRVPSLALAREIKARAPETFIVLGGCDCERDIGAEIVRQFEFVDAVVSGPGDVVFPEILKRVLSGEPVTGIRGVFTRAERASLVLESASTEPDIDDLPFPDYDNYFEQLEASGLPVAGPPFLMVETARGCWWADRGRKCTFCSENPGNAAYRSKSSARAIAEMAHITSRYKPSCIKMTDRSFDPSYFDRDSVIPGLASQPLAAEVFYSVRATLTRDQVRAFRDAGVNHLCIGIENLSTAVLKLMRKGTTGLHNIQVLKWAREYGLNPYWNVLWGFPGEPPAEYDRLARLVPRLVHLQPPNVATPVALMRFSPLYDQAEALGLCDLAPAPVYSYLYPFEPDAVANLAFYFGFSYQTPQDVDTYTRALKAALATWQQVHEGAELLFIHEDDSSLVWDRRPGAPSATTRLTGLEHTLLDACDHFQNLKRLRKEASASLGSIAEGEVEEALLALKERWLVINEGSKWLSLAVRARSTADQKRVRQAFAPGNGTD